MLSFPNAKINLGLNIVAKRTDGYHDLESCFYPIPWCDALEILPADKLEFTATGLNIPGDTEGNLCIKAYHLLREAHNIPPVRIHLHKVIPMGAGLGGGSSDGAFTLKLLNGLFDLNLSLKQLQAYAGQLGSDCPFFIENRPIFATGTGDVFSEVTIDLSGCYLAVKHPGIHVSTREAFAAIKPHQPARSITEILESPRQSWKDQLFNDFEESIFPNHSEIAQLKEDMYQQGAFYAAMSGSGSAVFGLFETAIAPEGYHVFQLA